ncbi:hypothetical protein YK48G_17260 [Lentilactobacillus fungorum]|uniref:Uncharacterized protein n=2 Tax=Lentilactobacillus fungorum TaxID=2201250 RepID=A0ABQ3W0T4_9LACO|nr:hypothetical protein YK48G_17260 [Lentilactobacillus fungorum]
MVQTTVQATVRATLPTYSVGSSVVTTAVTSVVTGADNTTRFSNGFSVFSDKPTSIPELSGKLMI